jgi:endonuclease III
MNKEKANKILGLLKKRYPRAKIILNFENNFELLVSVMLSAQTTDIQVNKVTEKLFPKYRGETELVEIENFANINLKELEQELRSVGLYKTKAKNVKLVALKILTDFNGKVPHSMNSLVSLPGVGRKTANVVLGNAFGIYEGIAVDTHVARLSNKYGFSREKSPIKIEKDLMKLFEKNDWFALTYLLIEHGRNIRKTKKDFVESLL